MGLGGVPVERLIVLARPFGSALVLVVALAASVVAGQAQTPAPAEPARPAQAEPSRRAVPPPPTRPGAAPASADRPRGAGQSGARSDQNRPAPAVEAEPEVVEEVPAPAETVERPSSEPAPDAPVAGGGSVADALSGRDLFHGHYCGLGSRPGATEPTDELDAACKRHDECYEATGQRACSCDRALRTEAIGIANSNRFPRELRTRAGTIAQAAELMRCVGP